MRGLIEKRVRSVSPVAVVESNFVYWAPAVIGEEDVDAARGAVIVDVLRSLDRADGAQVVDAEAPEGARPAQAGEAAELGLVGVAGALGESETQLAVPVVDLPLAPRDDRNEILAASLLYAVRGAHLDHALPHAGGTLQHLTALERPVVCAGGAQLCDVLPVEGHLAELVAVELEGLPAQALEVALQPLP
jgi:hypothetical protein